MVTTKQPIFKILHSLASRLLQNNDFTANPSATHVETEQLLPPVHRGDVVVPPYDFPDEIHNEDSHHSRLAIGFLCTKEPKLFLCTLANIFLTR